MSRIRQDSGAYPSWFEVRGFKSIKDPARIQLRPLTLLAGGNSSGKSSILQPLLLLKQSGEVPYDPDPLLLNGSHVAFTSLDQFLSRGRRQDEQSKSFSVTFGPFLDAGPKPAGGSDALTKLTFEREGTEQALRYRPMVRMPEPDDWLELSRENLSALRTLAPWTESHPEFHLLEQRLSSQLILFPKVGKQRQIEAFTISTEAPLAWLRSLLHLPGHRGHRDRRYPNTRVTTDSRARYSLAGPMPPYAASLLQDWRRLAAARSRSQENENEQEKAAQNLAQVNDGLKRLGLTWKVHSEAVDAADLELQVGRLPLSQRGGSKDLVDIADVGFGVSQVLPVLVALAAAVPGQMVLIEQPELHLHPRAQLAMGGVLADAASRGVIVVVETHSQLILRAIQTIVAKGDLKPEDVGLHWFTRDPKTGWSTVDLAELKDDGTFGDWPVDFPDVFAMADEAFIDAVFRQEDGE